MKALRLAVLLLLAWPAFAKSLQWRAVDVKAHLDRDGNLRVVESLTFLFDGDWNGGERTFRLSGWQELTLNSLVRKDGPREVPLVEGDLEKVGDYAWSGDVLRWRSRLPTDPPFANAERIYVIDYTLTNVLEESGGTYRLHHDFGMPEAGLPIEKFSLQLTFDPVWEEAAPVMMAPVPLAAGESMVITRNMTYAGAEQPAGVHVRIPAWVGFAALLLFAMVAALLVWKFVRDEAAAGRLRPLVADSQDIDEVLRMRAEVAGAAWDGRTGENEVAATLARLTQEEKISSSVRGNTLHLRLEVDRSKFHGYERELIAKLFAGNSRETDTDSIRARYTGSGFDPAEVIRPGIEEQLQKRLRWDGRAPRVRAWPSIVAVAVSLVLMVVAAAAGGEGDVVATLLAFLLGTFLGAVATSYAARQSDRLVDLGGPFLLLTILYGASLAVFILCSVFARNADLGVATPFAMAIWHLAWLHLILHLLRIRDTPEKIRFRRRVAAVRQWIARELDKPQPALDDDWFPHLIAFGLGKNAARWFRAFGSATVYGSSSTSSDSSLSSSSSGSSTPSWTGGGGAFGGAGATGSWAAAAAVVGSGVAAPSSSGDGGSGGGGGSSSGGGGGGGW